MLSWEEHLRPGTSWLAGIVGAALVLGAGAQAQVPGEQGFFGAIDGRWMWIGGDRVENSLGSATNVTNGPGGQLLVGYKLDPNWDIALAGGIQQLLSEVTRIRGGTRSVDTNHQHIDLEVGYSRDDWRINFGLRGVHYLMAVTYNVPGFAGYDQRELYGLGPKTGIVARFPLSDTFTLVGGLDAALVMTNFVDSGSGLVMANGNSWQLVPQAGAELGIGWRSSDQPGFAVTVGARIEGSFNTSITADGTRRGTLLEYGPFIRLSYNFSGPAYRVPAVATSTDAPATTTPSHMVFFDFDRADLTAVALGTIRQAATSARNGRATKIQLTGHADRAGSDNYNMALSLRRANAVKSALIKEGIAEQAIVVIGRGEGEPLVPTADGVPQPQNRRVVIAF